VSVYRVSGINSGFETPANNSLIVVHGVYVCLKTKPYQHDTVNCCTSHRFYRKHPETAVPNALNTTGSKLVYLHITTNREVTIDEIQDDLQMKENHAV